MANAGETGNRFQTTSTKQGHGSHSHSHSRHMHNPYLIPSGGSGWSAGPAPGVGGSGTLGMPTGVHQYPGSSSSSGVGSNVTSNSHLNNQGYSSSLGAQANRAWEVSPSKLLHIHSHESISETEPYNPRAHEEDARRLEVHSILRKHVSAPPPDDLIADLLSWLGKKSDDPNAAAAVADMLAQSQHQQAASTSSQQQGGQIGAVDANLNLNANASGSGDKTTPQRPSSQ